MPKEWLSEILGAVLELIGANVQRMIDRAVEERVKNIPLARVAIVATEAELGYNPISTQTGPNGPQTHAKVWLDDDPATRQAIGIPVMPGVTLTGGEVVWVMFQSVGGTPAWIVNKV